MYVTLGMLYHYFTYIFDGYFHIISGFNYIFFSSFRPSNALSFMTIAIYIYILLGNIFILIVLNWCPTDMISLDLFQSTASYLFFLLKFYDYWCIIIICNFPLGMFYILMLVWGPYGYQTSIILTINLTFYCVLWCSVQE